MDLHTHISGSMFAYLQVSVTYNAYKMLMIGTFYAHN